MNLPGMYTLAKKLGDLHGRDPTGVLARGLPAGADSAVAETGRGAGYDRIEANGGPGMPLKLIFPINMICQRSLKTQRRNCHPR